MSKKKGLPRWFPFAVAASAVTMLFSGAKSRWTLGKDQPSPPSPPPLPQGVHGLAASPYRPFWP